MENENNQDPSINSPHPAVAGSGQASEPEPINSLDPLQPTDANALAGKQGGGTSSIPEPISTPPTENPPTPFAERGQISQGNPPTPLYQGGETAPSPIKSLLLKAKEMIQFRKRKKLEKILDLAQTKQKITNNDIEKFLRVSDATATRYLSQLVKEGKLKPISRRGGAFYQLP